MSEQGKFERVSLDDIKKVSLMKRVDQKFVLVNGQLDQLLDSISNLYYMLEIDCKSKMHYKTTYFDTPNDDMYNAHHNGKLNRFKIRYRNYTDTGSGFLELKFKDNKGQTTKSRIAVPSISGDFSSTEADFIYANTPYTTDNLSVKLQNQFSRITIVDKQFKERCTIDSGISFQSGSKNLTMDNMVIVELKSSREWKDSILKNQLTEMGLKPTRFSKYYIGRALTDTSVKKNQFKKRMRQLERGMLQGISPFSMEKRHYDGITNI